VLGRASPSGAPGPVHAALFGRIAVRLKWFHGRWGESACALAPIGRHMNGPPTPDSPVAFLDSCRCTQAQISTFAWSIVLDAAAQTIDGEED
jgi:hypothetical protein